MRHYRQTHREKCAGERHWFRSQRNLTGALRLAGLAKDSRGKRYSHQYRLKAETLKKCAAVLLQSRAAIRRAHDFQSLHSLVSELIGDIKGVGELMVYDTAIRIGAYQRLEPTEVFLHAGTRRGAAALGLEARGATIALSKLPAAFQSLTCVEAEDILCIYKG